METQVIRDTDMSQYKSGLKMTTAHVPPYQWINERTSLLKRIKSVNDNNCLTVIMNNMSGKTEEYVETLKSSPSSADIDAKNAEAVNNHVVSILSAVKDNPDIMTIEDMRKFTDIIKSANAADVVFGGNADNYAIDAIDFAAGHALVLMGRQYVKNGYASSPNADKTDEKKYYAGKGFEALKSGKVDIENYGAIAVEQFSLKEEHAKKLKRDVQSKAALAEKTKEQAMTDLAMLNQTGKYEALSEHLLKAVAVVASMGGDIFSAIDFKPENQIGGKEDISRKEGTKTYFVDKESVISLRPVLTSGLEIGMDGPKVTDNQDAINLANEVNEKHDTVYAVTVDKGTNARLKPSVLSVPSGPYKKN